MAPDFASAPLSGRVAPIRTRVGPTALACATSAFLSLQPSAVRRTGTAAARTRRVRRLRVIFPETYIRVVGRGSKRGRHSGWRGSGPRIRASFAGTLVAVAAGNRGVPLGVGLGGGGDVAPLH